MSVRFVESVLAGFSSRRSVLGPVSISLSAPWHFNESRETKLQVGSARGLYLYSRPATPNWQLPARDNTSEVWYIGKSKTDLSRRIHSHMGTAASVNDRPRFPNHKWAQNCDYIAEDVRAHIAAGDVVVYTVAIDAATTFGYLAEMIEKHVLIEYALAHGGLPVLNRQI